MPWDDFIKLGLGKMGIRPDDFWNMSFDEFYLAVDGFAEFHGAEEKQGMTKDDLKDLMERYPD